MKKLLIKVCGLKDATNISALSGLEIDLFGFIFYPPSPRHVEENTTALDLLSSTVKQKKTGVFVNETAENIRSKANTYNLDFLQLHGRESPEFCHSFRPDFKVLKAFAIAEASDFEARNNYEGACDYFLFDTKGPKHGGNGISFDWGILDHYSGETPFFLSGGISLEDAEKINNLKHEKLAGLDLNSRFETAPGLKNVALLQAFINQIH